MKCTHPVELIFSQKKRTITEYCHNILYCLADDNYSILYLNNGNNIQLSKCLKQIENELPKSCFYRIHRKCLINIRFIKVLERNKIILADKSEHILATRMSIVELKKMMKIAKTL